MSRELAGDADAGDGTAGGPGGCAVLAAALILALVAVVLLVAA